MTNITQELATQFPDSNKGISAVVEPFSEQVVDTQIRVLFWSLMGAVAFVLLIACANVANLLLARAADRSREIAVRVAIGATRWRIVRQLLVESVLLAFISGVAGLRPRVSRVRWFDAHTADIGMPYWMVFSMDATRLCVLRRGLPADRHRLRPRAGALRLETNVNEVLKEGGRRDRRGRARGAGPTALIVPELTLTLVLLAGAGLMMRSFLNLYRMDIGVDTSRLVVMQLDSSDSHLLKPRIARTCFFSRSTIGSTASAPSRVRARPTICRSMARRSGASRSTAVRHDGWQRPLVSIVAVGSAYFDALGVKWCAAAHSRRRRRCRAAKR